MSSLLDDLEIPMAFCAGNRINRIPLDHRHEIQRIDVRGDAGRVAFCRRLWMGRLI